MKLGVLTYLENNQKILMIHRQKNDEHKGLWLAPGGKIEKNESPVESAFREFYEETGLKIKYPKLKSILSFPDYGKSPFGDEWQIFVFYTNKYEGNLKKNCPEGTLKWININKILKLPMWEGDKFFTPKIFDEDFFMAKIIYEGKKLIKVIDFKIN